MYKDSAAKLLLGCLAACLAASGLLLACSWAAAGLLLACSWAAWLLLARILVQNVETRNSWIPNFYILYKDSAAKLLLGCSWAAWLLVWLLLGCCLAAPGLLGCCWLGSLYKM